MLKIIKSTSAALALAISTFVASTPTPATAYQVDCAILLCLSGGWPASAPCAHARAVFIRRITPWPISPPLQIWRCPMRAAMNTGPGLTPTERLYDFAFADAPLQSVPAFPLTSTPDVQKAILETDQTPDAVQDAMVTLAQNISRENGTADIDISGIAFDFVRSIRVWRVDYFHHRRGRDDCNLTDNTYLGTYGTQGDFNWNRSSGYSVPIWMGLRTSCGGRFYRGVGIEWTDYEGNHGHELVRY